MALPRVERRHPLALLPGSGGGRGSGMDFALSRQGIALGRALAEGRIAPDEVGMWIHATV